MRFRVSGLVGRVRVFVPLLALACCGALAGCTVTTEDVGAWSHVASVFFGGLAGLLGGRVRAVQICEKCAAAKPKRGRPRKVKVAEPPLPFSQEGVNREG